MIYCSQCGAPNDDNAASCARCGQPVLRPGQVAAAAQAQVVPGERIPNYLVQSILVTICCCLIPGIVAIVYSAQVNGKFQAGDYDGARRCSRLAYIWAWVSFGLGASCLLLYLVFAALGFATSR